MLIFCSVMSCEFLFFFKQKTAYEVRISDWSSDVCSSDVGMDLTVDRLGVTLAARPVLHDIGAVFRPGRVTAILGPNGAGKSTLVKAMAALVAIQSGAIRLGERDVAALAHRDRARPDERRVGKEGVS